MTSPIRGFETTRIRETVRDRYIDDHGPVLGRFFYWQTMAVVYARVGVALLTEGVRKFKHWYRRRRMRRRLRDLDGR